MVAERTLIIATGGHSGLGLESFRQILKSPPASLPAPYRLILLGRKSAGSQKGLEELKALADADSLVELREFDLLDLSVVRKVGKQLAEELEKPAAAGQPKDVLRALFLNAGMMAGTQKRIQDKEDKSGKADGLKDAKGYYDETLLVNHVVHLVLVNAILNDKVLPKLTEPLRIVLTCSIMHHIAMIGTFEGTFDASQPLGKWNDSNAYSGSKFIQALGARSLASKLEKRLEGGKPGPKSIEIILAHPGFVPSTTIASKSALAGPLFKVLGYIPIPYVIQTIPQGAATLRYALVERLNDLQGWIPFTNKNPRWTQPGARVQGAYVTTGGSLASVNSRTANEELAARWWPSVADEV